MKSKQALKVTLLRSLQLARALPSVWQIRNPFKIHEFKQVMRCAHPARGEQALDLGCGGGLQTQLLATQMQNVVGVDLSAGSIQKAVENLRWSKVRDRVRFCCGALQELKMPPKSLDAVYSFCVLEHIPELNEVLAEILRLLKPGGRLQVSVDSLGTIEDTALVAKHRRDHYVHQYFTPASLQHQLTEAGFELKQVFPILTGPIARQEFEARIREVNTVWRPIRRLSLYRQISAEDRQARGERGIMLVAHAEKL